MSKTVHHPQKTLGFAEIFSISTGTMISSGLFVLPAIIYAKDANSVVAAYLLAGLLLIPSLLAKTELMTAMPKSGGTYFVVERSLGPLWGAFAGFASWFSISLKGSFSLMGIGAFITMIAPEANPLTFKLIALSCVFIFTIINLSGAHQTSKSQIFMVCIILVILITYIIWGLAKAPHFDVEKFVPANFKKLLPLSGMAFVSFSGVTKIAAISHEIKDPNRILPRSTFSSVLVVIVIYTMAVAVTTNLLGGESFQNTLTPLSDGAFVIAGQPGSIILAIAALLAFATTANSSVLSAAHNPAAMAKDGLLPAWLGRSNQRGVPVSAVILTGIFMSLSIILLDLSNLIKAASTMQLLLFLLINCSLILMRESRLVSYRPSYKTPLYPIFPIAGILISSYLIYAMGTLPLMLSAAFFLITTVWSSIYRHGSPKRDSALLRIVERVASKELRSSHLSEELGHILLEREGITDNRFDQLIRKAIILNIEETISCEKLFEKLASAFSLRLSSNYNEILDKLHQREAESTTMLSEDLAIPHIVLDDKEDFEIVIVRAQKGVVFREGSNHPKIIFALAGTMEERNFHLQCLMAIAQITQTTDFLKRWHDAYDEEELRLLVLLSERMR